MKKHILTFVTIFWVSFSIQAQHPKNADQKSRLFKGIVRAVVFEDEKGTQNHYLYTNSGTIPVQLENEELSNIKVSVRGNLDDKGVLVPEKVEILEQQKSDLEQPETNLEQPITNFNLSNSVTRSIAVILVNFINDTSQPVSHEAMRRAVFTDPTSANAFWQRTSRGRLRLAGRQREDGDVFGYLTLPFANYDCTLNRADQEWRPAAAQLARERGIDVDSYQTVIYVFPGLPGCSVAFADIGPISNHNVSLNVTTFGHISAKTMAHEIGHNLGLAHSNSYGNCPSNQPFQNCSSGTIYGDYDVMGTYYHLLHNYNLLRLGWLSGKTRTFDSPGVYYTSLVSPNQLRQGISMVKIRLKDPSGNFTDKSLFLEYRQPKAPFDIFQPQTSIDKGLSVRFAYENTSITAFNQLIDFKPDTRLGDDGTLLPGNTFTNSYYGFSISTLSVDPKRGLQVKIELTR
jgi:hypothetical protein